MGTAIATTAGPKSQTRGPDSWPESSNGMPTNCQNKHHDQGRPEDRVEKGILSRKKNPTPAEESSQSYG